MDEGHAGPRQLRRLLDAVIDLGSDLELDVVLERLVAVAVDLLDARFGALGVLDRDRTHLSDFITVGIDPAGVESIGARPKGHGILGLLIVDPRPLRLPDLAEHPDSFGFPPNHPPMTSFLGVPVFVDGVVYGNLYLTDKRGVDTRAGSGAGSGVEGQLVDVFTDVDEEMAIALAAAAGIAIEKARLHERARDLYVIEDRDRIARDLHDTVIQRLFATGLSLNVVARLAQPLPDVVERIETCIDDLDEVVRQIRTTIFELHPPTTSTGGLRHRLLAVGDELRDALGATPSFTFDGPLDSAVDDDLAGHVVAVVGEALTNVARHAEATSAQVAVVLADGLLTVTVDDDGRGIPSSADPRRRGGRGMDNLQARAAEVDGTTTVEPRPEGGTRVRWAAPLPIT